MCDASLCAAELSARSGLRGQGESRRSHSRCLTRTSDTFMHAGHTGLLFAVLQHCKYSVFVDNNVFMLLLHAMCNGRFQHPSGTKKILHVKCTFTFLSRSLKATNQIYCDATQMLLEVYCIHVKPTKPPCSHKTIKDPLWEFVIVFNHNPPQTCN